MEATICSAPDVTVLPERQPTKLPDQGSAISKDDRKRFRRAMFAGMATSSQGAMGTPNIAQPTLG